MCAFLRDVASGFVGNFLAGLLLLGLAYWFVDNKLQLRQRADARADEEVARGQVREAVMGAVLAELISNAVRLREFVAVLEKGHIPAPGFDTTGWELISQVTAFASLRFETIKVLTHSYNRMRSANDHLAFVTDLNNGQTAIMVNATLAPHLSKDDDAEALPQVAFTKFVNLRELSREDLLARLEDLKGWIDKAIDAVEEELGTPGGVPAAQRIYDNKDSVLMKRLAELEAEAEPPSDTSAEDEPV